MVGMPYGWSVFSKPTSTGCSARSLIRVSWCTGGNHGRAHVRGTDRPPHRWDGQDEESLVTLRLTSVAVGTRDG
jgi:hypothetical protein